MVELRTVSFPLWICPSRAALLIEKTTSQTNSQENQIAILVSAERGEPEYPEKNLSEQKREPNLTAGKEPSQLVLVLEAKSEGRYRRGDRPIIKSVLCTRFKLWGKLADGATRLKSLSFEHNPSEKNSFSLFLTRSLLSSSLCFL